MEPTVKVDAKDLAKAEASIKFIVTHLENPKCPGKPYVCNLSKQIALSCPTINCAISYFSEGTKGVYTYGDENVTYNSLQIFFTWKRLVVYNEKSNLDFSKFTSTDWKCAMFIAVYLGDLSFFDKDDDLSPIFPSLDFMESEVLNLPSEGFVLYVEEYIVECFGYEQNWITKQEKKRLKQKLRIDLSAELYDLHENTFLNPKSMLASVLHFAKLQPFNITPELLISFSIDALILENTLDDRASMYIYERQKKSVQSWQELSYELRETIVKLYFDYKIIKIGDVFVGDWNTFFKSRPELAQVIWSFMDREELLKITNVPHKRRGVALKSDDQQMREYLDRLGPKVHTIDPYEKQLRENLTRALSGVHPYGCSTPIVDQKEVRIAEAKLKKYVNRCKNEKAMTVVSTSYSGINSKMFSLSKK
jgi:hypothetical protein